MKKLLPLLLLILIGCITSKPPLLTPPKYYQYLDQDTQEITTYSIDGSRLVLYSGTHIQYDEDGNVISKYTYKDGKPDGEWIDIVVVDGEWIDEGWGTRSTTHTIIYEDGIDIKSTRVHIFDNTITTSIMTRIDSSNNWKVTSSEQEID